MADPRFATLTLGRTLHLSIRAGDQKMRHQLINAQLLGQAQAALDAKASQPRATVSIIDRLLRHGLVWGALTLLALVALATVVSGLN